MQSTVAGSESKRILDAVGGYEGSNKYLIWESYVFPRGWTIQHILIIDITSTLCIDIHYVFSSFHQYDYRRMLA